MHLFFLRCWSPLYRPLPSSCEPSVGLSEAITQSVCCELQVGKSLLIRCLARHYARRTVGAVRGPVTLVASKQRRLTFVECPNDACGMVDAAKVADIALLLIDAQYG